MENENSVKDLPMMQYNYSLMTFTNNVVALYGEYEQLLSFRMMLNELDPDWVLDADKFNDVMHVDQQIKAIQEVWSQQMDVMRNEVSEEYAKGISTGLIQIYDTVSVATFNHSVGHAIDGLIKEIGDYIEESNVSENAQG